MADHQHRRITDYGNQAVYLRIMHNHMLLGHTWVGKLVRFFLLSAALAALSLAYQTYHVLLDIKDETYAQTEEIHKQTSAIRNVDKAVKSVGDEDKKLHDKVLAEKKASGVRK